MFSILTKKRPKFHSSKSKIEKKWTQAVWNPVLRVWRAGEQYKNIMQLNNERIQ